MDSSKSGMVFLGAFLAVGLTMSGYFIGQTMYNGKVALNTAEAKGLAERVVEADKADWTIGFRRSWKGESDISEQYKLAEKDQVQIVDFLLKNGLAAKSINNGVINYSKREFRNKEQVIVDHQHYLVGSITVSTDKVQLISEVRSKLNSLIAKGVDLENNMPSYRFTRLNDIKPEMLEEATKNARIAANEFAKNANAKVGGIRNATQGSFYIKDEGEDYGDTKKLTKMIRVVTTITFYLKDSI